MKIFFSNVKQFMVTVTRKDNATNHGFKVHGIPSNHGCFRHDYSINCRFHGPHLITTFLRIQEFKENHQKVHMQMEHFKGNWMEMF